MLASEWREEEKRNKRFYRLTPDGEQIFAQLLGEWQAINASVTATLNSTTDAGSGTL
jgi:DNA-binding PadR family transcriptional regulator